VRRCTHPHNAVLTTAAYPARAPPACVVSQSLLRPVRGREMASLPDRPLSLAPHCRGVVRGRGGVGAERIGGVAVVGAGVVGGERTMTMPCEHIRVADTGDGYHCLECSAFIPYADDPQDDDWDGEYHDDDDDDEEDDWLYRCGWVRGIGCTLAGS